MSCAVCRTRKQARASILRARKESDCPAFGRFSLCDVTHINLSFDRRPHPVLKPILYRQLSDEERKMDAPSLAAIRSRERDSFYATYVASYIGLLRGQRYLNAIRTQASIIGAGTPLLSISTALSPSNEKPSLESNSSRFRASLVHARWIGYASRIGVYPLYDGSKMSCGDPRIIRWRFHIAHSVIARIALKNVNEAGGRIEKSCSPIDLVHRGGVLQDSLLPRHLDDALRTEFQLCNEKKKLLNRTRWKYCGKKIDTLEEIARETK